VLATDQLSAQAGDDYAQTAIDGETAAGLILQNQDDTKESLLILNSVITSNSAQADRDISQVQQQLEGLKDNRALRHFKGQEVQQQRQAQRPTSKSSSLKIRISPKPQDQSQRRAQPSNARGAERNSRLGSYFYGTTKEAGSAGGRSVKFGMGGGMVVNDMGGLGITNSVAVQVGQQVAGFDALICSAGRDSAFKPFDALTDEDYRYGFERKFLGQTRLVAVGQEHVRDNGSFTLTSGFLNHYPNPSSIATGPLNSAVDTFAANAAPLLPRGVRLNVVSPAPVVEPSQEGRGRVTAEQTAQYYVEAVQGDMTGQVLRAWGGLPIPSAN
jgi:NAD(P)-dependent dehydrogenase (short-subunit alcohol dehydrogenase family)